MILLWIGLGGALGSILRYWVQLRLADWSQSGFPYGTFAVNVVGSFIMGYLFWKFAFQWTEQSVIKNAVLIGVLGGFTTFSSFSNDTLQLILTDQYLKALIYMLSSVIVCVLFAAIGWVLAKHM